jgi:O-antigen/teichoic acid export membrane protein
LIQTLLTVGALRAFSVGLNVVRSKIISLALGPAGLGVVGAIDQLMNTLVQLSSLSLPAVGVKVLSRAHSEDRALFERKYASLFRAVAATSTIGTLVAIGVVRLFPGLLPDGLEAYRDELTVALLAAPVMAIGLLQAAMLAAAQRPGVAALFQFGVAASTALAACVAAYVGGIRGLYTGSLILLTILNLVLIFYVRRSAHLSIWHPGAGVMRELRESPGIVKSAAVVYLSVTSGAISLLAPRLATLHSLGAEAAGLLQSILSMALAVTTVLGAMNTQYLGPLLNRRSTEAEKIRLAELFQKRQMMFLALGAAPLVLFPEIALTALFSPRFTPAAAWLPMLLVWTLLNLQGAIQQQLLFSLDDLRPMMIAALVSFVVTATLPFVFVPFYGLTGAVVPMVAGAACGNVLALASLRRHGYVLPRVLAGLAIYVILGLLTLPVGAAVAGGAVVARIILAVLFTAGLWLFLDGGERAALLKPLGVK